MWTCDRCGRQFANVNQAHACQTTTDIDHLAGKTVHAVRIYRAVYEALQEAGIFRVHAQKTRIAFSSKMTFASVRMAKRWVNLGFILPDPLDSPRVRRLEAFGPSTWRHTIRLSQASEVDSQVERWLAESLLRGDQETLDPDHEVRPLNDRQLAVFSASFRGRIRGGRMLVPGHLADALAATDEIILRVQGVESVAELDRSGATTSVKVDAEEGTRLDVTIKGIG